VGFEYKTIYLQDYDNWVKEVLNQEDASYFFDSYITDASPLEFRVKYLDKEDIESLGFKFDRTSEGNKQHKFYKNNIRLFYRYDTKELGTFTMDPSRSDYFSKYNRDNKMISFLIIKNKSELKVLLKQLNII